MKVVLDP